MRLCSSGVAASFGVRASERGVDSGDAFTEPFEIRCFLEGGSAGVLGGAGDAPARCMNFMPARREDIVFGWVFGGAILKIGRGEPMSLSTYTLKMKMERSESDLSRLSSLGQAQIVCLRHLGTFHSQWNRLVMASTLPERNGAYDQFDAINEQLVEFSASVKSEYELSRRIGKPPVTLSTENV